MELEFELWVGNLQGLSIMPSKTKSTVEWFGLDVIRLTIDSPPADKKTSRGLVEELPNLGGDVRTVVPCNKGSRIILLQLRDSITV